MPEPREIVLFLSYENDDPKALAERLVSELDEAPIAAGQNPLSGGVELRFHWHPDRVNRLKNWLRLRGARGEVDEK